MYPLPVLAGGGLFIAVIQHCIVLYLHLTMVSTPTKSPAKASTKVATPARTDDDVVIVGLLKNTQEFIGQGENASVKPRVSLAAVLATPLMIRRSISTYLSTTLLLVTTVSY